MHRNRLHYNRCDLEICARNIIRVGRRVESDGNNYIGNLIMWYEHNNRGEINFTVSTIAILETVAKIHVIGTLQQQINRL